MRIDIITIFPEFFNSFFEYSILKRAQKNNIVSLNIHNLRDYSRNKQKSVQMQIIMLMTINLEEDPEWSCVFNQ